MSALGADVFSCFTCNHGQLPVQLCSIWHCTALSSRSPRGTPASVDADQSPQFTPQLSEATSPRPTESGSVTPISSGRSPRSPVEISSTVPAVTSVSAPSNVGRMTAHQLGYPAATNIDLSVVLSDVAEEDTDLEDGGHVSPVELSLCHNCDSTTIRLRRKIDMYFACVELEPGARDTS